MTALRRAALLCFVLSGCASNNVVFLTKTSLGVDVAAQPSTASIGYDRVEGYFGPRYDNGAVPPVAASFETNGQLLGRQVRQVYATGDAALEVSGEKSSPGVQPALTGGHKPMLFNASTTVGLKLGFGDSGATDVFTFGYKRREVSVIPVTEDRFPSVIATIQNDVAGESRAGAQFGVGQYFATGQAALAVSRMDAVKTLFDRRLLELIQGKDALAILTCLSDLPDADLPRVWQQADGTKLFDPDQPTLPQQLKTMAAPQARAAYTRHLALIDRKSAERTTKVERHRAFVCGLAGR